MRRIAILTVLGMCSAVFGVLLGGPAQAADEYVGQGQCKVCHNKAAEGEQWNKWKAEKHAKAFDTLKTPEADKIAKDKGLTKPAAESPECLKCHVTAYDAATSAAPAKIVPADGVQCESCHGAGSQHMDAGKKKMFKKDESVDPKQFVTKIDESTCTKCHNDQSPTWKADRYTKADGTKVGFDYEQAKEKVSHPNPLKKK